MPTRQLSYFFLSALALALASCSGTAPGRYPVKGNVTYKGQPAAGASVHFRREGETPEESSNFPIGIVDQDGNFELKAEGLGYGALPGKYKVLVLWAPDAELNAPAGKTTKKGKRAGPSVSVGEARRDPSAVTDRLNFRYFKPEKPLLTAEVKPEANNLEPFELKD
jgi:hypothetical protein